MVTALQPATRRDPLQVLALLARRKGDVFVYAAGPPQSFLVNRPEHARHVLVDRSAQYSKDTPINAGFDLTVASGLLTSEGETWRRQRSLMQPYFSRRRLPAFADIVIKHVESMSRDWDRCASTGDVVDLTFSISLLTFRLIADALFHADTSAWDARTVAILAEALPVLTDLDEDVFRLAQRDLGTRAFLLVADRLDSPAQDDLLGALMASGTEESGDLALYNHVVTMLLAGYETTASVITWGCYLLVQHANAYQEVRRELAATVGDRPLMQADLPSLPYLTAVVKETMRLYPPAWIIGRRALEADRIGDIDIPRQSVVAVSPYTLHRHPRYWTDPDVFEPRRFLNDEAARRREPFAYIPFGAGPRTCIGSNFALVEAPLIIGRLLQRYDMVLVNQEPVAPRGIFVLVPSVPIRMRFSRR